MDAPAGWRGSDRSPWPVPSCPLLAGWHRSAAPRTLPRCRPSQQFPLIASPPLLLMSMGQFDHPFWFHARPMVTKIGAMSVSKQAYVRMGVDPTGDDWESPGLPTDISGKSVG